MTDSKLTDLLTRTANRTTVGPPPIDQMHAHVARRRRTVVVSVGAAFAVVAAVGGTALLVRPATSPEVSPPVASASPGVVAGDMRLVGLGHAAIAVPEAWGTNQTHCGTPLRDTVLTSRDPLLCALPRPAGVESVDLGRGRPATFDFTADSTLEIDGVRAERKQTTCVSGNVYEVSTCTGAVRIPSLDVWFWAESSTNAEEVDRLLERIRIVPGQVGVPSIYSVGGIAPERRGAEYADALRELGLKPKIQTIKSPSYAPGELLGVSPIAGTMLPVGTTVTLTVTAR